MIGLLHKNNEQKYSLNIVFTFSFCVSFRCMFLYCFLPVSFLPLAFILCPTPGCRAYRDPGVRRAETRMSDMSRPGCHAIPFRISVFSFSLLLFLSARMRIYYNVSLLPDFPPSLKKHVLQHICQSAFYKNVQEKREKIPLYIWCVCYKVLLLHPLSNSKQRWLTLFLESGSVKQSFFCSPFRKRDDGKKGKMKKNFRKYLEDILKSFYLCIRFPEKKADIKEAIFEEIYINNTSSTRARLVFEKETVLGKIKRTVITY